VVLFDKEPDGVASIRFADAQAASACVRVSMIRFFIMIDRLTMLAHGWPVVQ
jgi:hypothetical protein